MTAGAIPGAPKTFKTQLIGTRPDPEHPGYDIESYRAILSGDAHQPRVFEWDSNEEIPEEIRDRFPEQQVGSSEPVESLADTAGMTTAQLLWIKENDPTLWDTS